MALTIEPVLRRDDKSNFLKFSVILLNFGKLLLIGLQRLIWEKRDE